MKNDKQNKLGNGYAVFASVEWCEHVNKLIWNATLKHTLNETKTNTMKKHEKTNCVRTLIFK